MLSVQLVIIKTTCLDGGTLKYSIFKRFEVVFFHHNTFYILLILYYRPTYILVKYSILKQQNDIPFVSPKHVIIITYVICLCILIVMYLF